MPTISNPGFRWALSTIRSVLPTGRGWFSEQALKAGEIGHVARALARVSGRFLQDVRQARSGFYLKEATGEALLSWARDLNVEPMPNESEESLRGRLLAEMFRERMTKLGVIQLIQERTGLATSTMEPWRKTMTFDGDLAWGDDAAYSDHFYTGGVVQITTDDFSPQTRQVALEGLALGVKPYYVHRVGTLDGAPSNGRINDTGLTYEIQGERLVGVDRLAYGEIDPYDGVFHVEPMHSSALLTDIYYGFPTLNTRTRTWLTAYSWKELGAMTWEEWAVYNFRNQPGAYITRDGVEMSATYDQMHSLTYEQLSRFTYDEIKSTMG